MRSEATKVERFMKWIRTLAWSVCWLGCMAVPAFGGDKVPKVLVIGIDGVRTDALAAARTPNLDRLMRSGAVSTQTTIVCPRPITANTVSGPGWSNILTGVWPDKHGVVDNSFKGRRYDQHPHFFKLLKAVRPEAVAASFVSWPPIAQHIVSGADKSVTLLGADGDYAAGDRRVVEQATAYLCETNVDVAFVYLGNVDETGHHVGFSTKEPKYIAALETADVQVGTVVAAARARKTHKSEDWLVIVCTDHGGVGKHHGGGHKHLEITQVWLIVSGKSAKRGRISGSTALVDVVATAFAHLGVEPLEAWRLDGSPRGLKAR